jgi:Prenyltransferase and squalene oxidase repeat
MTPWSNGRPVAVARGTLAALSLATGILLLVCGTGSALAAPARYQGSLDSMVRYLQNDQNPDGGFGSEPGAGSNNDVSAWVALALAAAGVNPRDQTPANQHYIGGHSVYGYLTEHAGTLSSTTDFDRELLVVDATGASPTDFGSVNLLEKILQRQLTQPGPNDGAFEHEAGSGEPAMNDTIFAILALSPIHEPTAEAALRAAAEWVEREQDCDHGWPSTAYRTGGACPAGGGSLPSEPQSEVDMTGAAIEALNAASRQGQAEAVEQHAFAYLETAQDANGGFSEEPGNPEPNVASTAWVAQAMWSAGINPETWVTHSGLASEEPLGYMASLQQEDGHIRWEQSQEWNGVWMTAYVGTAMTGDTYPPQPPPDEPLPQAPTETSGSGQGGESSKSGGGVIAGGGGNGAPLFSRPQLGSQGDTPGGVRQLEDQRHNTTEQHRNPGPPRKTPAPTATAASAHQAKNNDPAGYNKGVGGLALTGTGAGGGGQSSGRMVKGLLIGAPADALEPGAPGLRGAGAGASQTPWLTVGIAVALLLSALIGTRIELRRPKVIV